MPCTGLSTVRGGVLPVQYRRLRRWGTCAGSAVPLTRLDAYIERHNKSPLLAGGMAATPSLKGYLYCVCQMYLPGCSGS